MKSTKEILETLYQLDKADYKKSEVLVPGYGRLSLQTLEQLVAEQFQQLADLSKSGGPEVFQKIQTVLEKGVLLKMVSAINQAYIDLEEIRKKGGIRSKAIPKI